MKWGDGKPTDVALIGLAIFSVLMFYLAEKTAQPERQPNYQKKMEAVQHAVLAQQVIRDYAKSIGIAPDAENDPYKTGLIGMERTPITSDRGMINAKILSTNPDYAAAFVDMLVKAKVRKGSLVAVGMTGSLPGWNIAFLSACAALEAKPVIITSVGASDWGANIPSLTWLDMERVLNERGIFPFRSVAASIGGPSDNGRGLSPEGRDLIHQAIDRNNVTMIAAENLQGSVKRRAEIYESESKGEPYACYVNIGGGAASLGGAQNSRLIPPGVSLHLAARNYPTRGVINMMAEQGLPVINLQEVEKIAMRYSLPTEVGDNPPSTGEGPLFFKDKYSVSSIVIITVLLAAVVFAVVRIDLRHYLVRRRTRATEA